uniref:Uncharacterized protein n=1 Tax=Tanacetum cinerariifolium TaxID=118510 RepID=A0A699VTE9_TANCI|nr:hypothetical protein [Tanacetum cinerariifolium]
MGQRSYATTVGKGEVLDAEAEAFLADVECTAPFEGQLAMTTTNIFPANHEDAYDSDVDDGPDASIAFMPSLPEENTIPYSEHMASNDEHPSGSYLQIPASTFLDLNAQITSLYKVNEERN